MSDDRWQEWRDHYADIDREELVKKLRRAHERTRFIPPADPGATRRVVPE